MYKSIIYLLLACATVFQAAAQPRFSKAHGLYDGGALVVSIEGNDAEAKIRYTTDGSEPTAKSNLYTKSLTITKTTILRAAEVKGDTLCSPISTASYIFVNSVLNQSNTPEGYPQQWGNYTETWGVATADYEMDPEMTGDATLRPKIIEGLKQLPILSIVTDKDNLFSHENDPDRGGIYIYTGPPVGDNTGHGWTRPASVELMGGPQQHDFSVACGLRLHGGHGRLADKNPKHSFRLVFKEQYGPKSLKYPLFGENEPKKFDQLVLRCHFGNAWQHWDEGNREKAQYTRDVWARRMQRKMGHTAVNALYVHLFLNGMYWGLYNIAERVDDQYGKDHLGGSKDDIDVIKIEEDGGNHIEASEGTLDAWNELVQTAQRAYDDTYYQKLDTLLDIDNFIDYMLINQYAGNTDWDHHNWYAIRKRGADSQGFRFLCWDSELIFVGANENVMKTNNGNSFPTGIFNNLLRNENFTHRYLKRAKKLLADDGYLGQDSVVAVWDSLYYTIDKALYDEAARWGDYRRDVHRWKSAGKLYTVDDTYQKERQRLLTSYFPYRSEFVLGKIFDYVGVDDFDDFEMPADWTQLTASMFHQWNGTGADAQPLDNVVNAEMNLGQNVGGGGVVAGFSSVSYNLYADLSDYDKLVIRGTGSGLRILTNRLVDHGSYKIIIVSLSPDDPYWDPELEAVAVPLDDFKTMATNKGENLVETFLHLNAIKVDGGNNATVKGIYLTPKPEDTGIALVRHSSPDAQHPFYTLGGVRVDRPTKPGIYVHNGKKIIIK
jgi:hypothetical protein